MRKKSLCIPCLFGALLILIIAAFGVWKIVQSRTGAAPAPPRQERSTLEEMMNYAQERLKELRAAGVNIETGPCLDNGEKFPGWVIDVAHSPRESVDNVPENQCSAYGEGRASQFIELTPNGEFLRQGQL